MVSTTVNGEPKSTATLHSTTLSPQSTLCLPSLETSLQSLELLYCASIYLRATESAEMKEVITTEPTADIEKGGEQPAEKPPVEEVFHPNALPFYKQNWFVVALILLLGGITSGAFIWLGVSTANQVQEDEFKRSAQDLVSKIESAWDDYVNAASWVHGRCRDRDFDRREFREIYEYLISSGLDFQAMQFDPNITDDERDFWEDEARQFYAEFYPDVNYRGFIGFNTANSTTLDPRWPAPFYFPIRKLAFSFVQKIRIVLDPHQRSTVVVSP